MSDPETTRAYRRDMEFDRALREAVDALVRVSGYLDGTQLRGQVADVAVALRAERDRIVRRWD